VEANSDASTGVLLAITARARFIERSWSRKTSSANVRREHVAQIVGRREPAIQQARSCSGCYREVDPAWQVCPICGMAVLKSTTHVTHPTSTVDDLERLGIDRSSVFWRNASLGGGPP
jgi:hypothetical protein